MIGRNGQPFTPDGGQPDPMSQYVGSMASAWTRGLEAWQSLTSLGNGASSMDTGAPFGTLLDQLSGMARSYGALMPQTASLGAATEAGQAAFRQAYELSPAMARACVAGASSALRYQSALAELVVQYSANLLRAASDRATGRSLAAPADCRVVADDMRAFIRGIGEVATREARRLEQDLTQVGEAIAQATDLATPSPHPYQHRRRHEMKP